MFGYIKKYNYIILKIVFFIFIVFKFYSLSVMEEGDGVFSMEIVNGPLNWILYENHVALINSKSHTPLVTLVNQQYLDISNNFSAYEQLLVPYVEIRKVEKISVYELQSDGDRLFLGILYVLFHAVFYNNEFLKNLEKVLNS